MNWQDNTRLQALIYKPRLGLISGMDGNLAPVSDSDGEPPTPRVRDLLAHLAERLALVAVLSARPANELHALFELPNVLYIGNRGMEQWIQGRLEISPEADSFRAALEAAMMVLYGMLDTGMKVEDEGSAILVYYEPSDDGSSSLDAIREAMQKVADQHGLRFFEATRVFELRPPMLVTKGTALERLVKTHNLDGVIFIGNDINDVDAMRKVKEMRDSDGFEGLAMGVLSEWTVSAAGDQADVMVEGLAGVEDFLAWLQGALPTPAEPES